MSVELERLSRRVSRAVVQIFSTGYARSEEADGGTNTAVVTRQRATGSGVILSADGYIVTNSHVVANARRVRVRVPAEMPGHPLLEPADKVLDARIVGLDRDSDLAVLKVDKTGLSFLSLGDSDLLRQGQLVMAFGNPLGLENSVSMGVVSSVARQVKPDDTMIYIQTDAPINPGNSGGPLVDVSGHVIGINTFILSQSGGNEGLGFAIPSNVVRNVYTQLRAEGHVHRSEIGVSVETITPALATGLRLAQDWGVVVADVEANEPAAKAGLEAGDIVLSLNGKTMRDARQFELNLYRYRVGQKVSLELLRGDTKLSVDVPVEEREDDPQRFADMVDPAKNTVSRLGILGIEIDRKIAAMLPELRKKYGVVVAARYGDSPYSGDSLVLGDVIYSVNTTPVTSVQALRAALDALKETDPLVMQVERRGRLLFVTMTIE
ncbi:MAG: trypsin-like peptidase domain-containing protein [Acidobacteria bacterium Pan2503]|uniref:Trypsin-like peptidase domain-containing protein n=1 Tax=Candidatus Acidiferrum panamense TaxID=2741543 RepID=A0A7V8NQU8_9BACT|nr:trypsin-like peptidase domain-containing protein [Candidatus Acidoferrum panamensis]